MAPRRRGPTDFATALASRHGRSWWLSDATASRYAAARLASPSGTSGTGTTQPTSRPAGCLHKVVDYPLTDLGVTQATTLAEQLARHPPPAAIFASPLRRATQTAEIIARHVGPQ